MSFFVDVTVGALGIIGIECICLRICFGMMICVNLVWMQKITNSCRDNGKTFNLCYSNPVIQYSIGML